MRRFSGALYALSIGFWLLTSVYALMASQSFAYEQFLKPQLLPPLARFAAWHPWIHLGVFAVTVGSRWPALRGPGRDATRLLLGVWGAAALLLPFLPPLTELAPGRMAPLVAGLALVPIGLILWAEWSSASPPETTATHGKALPDRISDDFFGCLAAGAAATLLYTLVSRLLGPEFASLSAGGAALGVMQSLLVHQLLFLAVFCGLTLIRGLAEYYVAGPCRAEIALAAAALTAMATVAMRSIVLPGLSIGGVSREGVALAFGLVLALAIAVRGVAASDASTDGVGRVLFPLIPDRVGRSPLATGLWFLALAWLALGLAYGSAQIDWNRILSRLSVVVLWLLLLATCLRVVRPGLPWRPPALFLTAVAVLSVHAALASPLAGRELAGAGVDPAAVRRAGLTRDPSFRFLDELLQPPARSDHAFFSLLQQHTNISRRLDIDPVELSLAKLEGAPSSYRPHIFIFIVDSLRRDYLSPYNRAVSFTPAIERFASESTVFRHAFTRYGATGLSVPALWAGAPLLHKQYVTPFAPMNTLAKLVAHEGYAQWIGMDNILDVILPPSPRRAPLDADITVKDFRFCRTLEELGERLAARARDDPPVFAYSLPQDIHVSVLTREGARSIDDADYPGFSAPVASRVRRFDACFGAFVEFLRARGLYDDSLIVLTSDHGDSLGEEGRIGHAYGLFPEVIRIPLIVSLPAHFRASWTADPAAPAYNTDLTPTLYRLLGHDLAASSDLFGRPLFHPPGVVTPPDRRNVMVASSYGAVYGALLESATLLYIVDTVNAREHGYTLGDSLLGTAVPVDGHLRRRAQATIRETIESLAELHNYRPGSSAGR